MVPTPRSLLLLRRAVVAFAIAAALVPAAPAMAHEGTCKGFPVTIFDGSPGDDVIIGTDGPDVIQGFGGNDVIYGGAGDDIICGGAGDDQIFGEAGNDLLVGGWGDDWIRGDDGDDDIRGNAGNDRLYAHLGVDIVRGGSGSDACGAETRWNCEMKKRLGHDPIDWIDFVEEYFGPVGEEIGIADLVDEALYVMDCESSGEPFAENPKSTASGLFQFLDGTWDSVSNFTGETENAYHPEANISNAAWLVRHSVVDLGKSRWSQWAKACRPPA